MKKKLLIGLLTVMAISVGAQTNKTSSVNTATTKVNTTSNTKTATTTKDAVPSSSRTSAAVTTSKSSNSLGSIAKVTIKDVRAMIDTSTTPMIVNFWASWCGPCIREIPYFDSLVAKQDKPIKLVLVSLDFADTYPKKLSAFVEKQGYKGQVLFLNEKDADYFCPVIDKRWNGEIPVSVFVNNQKKYSAFFGTQLTRERLAIEVKKLLE